MPRVSVWKLILAVALGAWMPQRAAAQTNSSQTPSAAEQTSALRADLAEIAKGKQAAERAWAALGASTGGAAAPSGDFAAEWMKTVAPNGPAAAPFYAGTEEIVLGWISSIENAANQNPPADELHSALQSWQEAHEQILDSLQQSASLEKSVRALEARVAKLKPESDEYIYYKAQLDQQQLTIRKLLSDAGSDLASAAAIPRPNLDSDRTPSPFAGAVNAGSADRIWIYLRKVSAPIGAAIPVEIGLGNDRGPNVVADQSYTISLSCDGCTVKSESVIILDGKRSAETEMRVSSATARLRAKTPRFDAAAQANAYGCYSAPAVALASEQDRSFGLADGETPIQFRFAFHSPGGQRATDGRRKTISPRLTGVGERISMQQSVGAILAKDGSIVIPGNECVVAQGVVSELVGKTKVDASYGAEKADALQFTFQYAFPWLDRLMILLGVLAGFIANYAITLRKQIHWGLALLSSVIGAAIFVGVGYMEFLNVSSLSDTWLVALALAAAGGVLGVSAARVVFHKVAPAAAEEEVTENV